MQFNSSDTLRKDFDFPIGKEESQMIRFNSIDM